MYQLMLATLCSFPPAQLALHSGPPPCLGRGSESVPVSQQTLLQYAGSGGDLRNLCFPQCGQSHFWRLRFPAIFNCLPPLHSVNSSQAGSHRFAESHCHCAVARGAKGPARSDGSPTCTPRPSETPHACLPRAPRQRSVTLAAPSNCQPSWPLGPFTTAAPRRAPPRGQARGVSTAPANHGRALRPSASSLAERRAAVRLLWLS